MIMILPGTELAPLLKHAVTGKPRKDPATGYMMNHSLPSTDVTRLATQGSVSNSSALISGFPHFNFKKPYCLSLSYKSFPFIAFVQLSFPLGVSTDSFIFSVWRELIILH